ncbi:MAG: holo-ACP synthase [Nitrospinae bacterium]|nr:holo-ACP synthase [Nitrospinota bacterium]MBF0633958.1 holo-ACP synthase [Nitrospinota bacterium]
MAVRTGIDLCDPERIKRAVERHGEKFLAHVFTPGEIKYCSSFADSSLSYAARFAAKEAVMKTLGAGIGKISFTEIEVVSDEEGRPRAILRGKAKAIAERLDVTSLDISLTHVRGMCSASAVALIGGGGAIMPADNQ